jgi:hypothetical protein
MTRKTKPPQNAYVLGRDRFAQISAIEGLALSAGMKEDFREFDRQGLSAAERRRELARKYGHKR